MQIPGIQPFAPNPVGDMQSTHKAGSPASEVSQTFGEVLEALNRSQTESDLLMQKLAGGEDVDLHQVMIAAEENDVNFRVALAIRDRLVDAYREVMRMNV